MTDGHRSLGFILLTVILLIIFLVLSEEPEQPGIDILTVHPLETNISENQVATFRVTINTSFDLLPVFYVTPIREKDKEVLTIDKSELENIGVLYKDNSITRNLRISGRVAHGELVKYGIKIELRDEKSGYKESEIVYVIVNRGL